MNEFSDSIIAHPRGERVGNRRQRGEKEKEKDDPS